MPKNIKRNTISLFKFLLLNEIPLFDKKNFTKYYNK
ncbi:MAG: hypothetical protein UR27_C0006G0010 [Candidatus Peregrinibacteria bacterium GW2011_GWA2_33_10]|nr:MAG: hypothetical protein UR27_C0006G0010 [Candidatus Peregrinibacteria bacterium GW2011_GWA2_33_10]